MNPAPPVHRSPRERLARALWRAAAGLVTPAYLARVRRRGRVEPLYAERIGERTGQGSGERPAPGALWLHAVSLGETLAAEPLVQALRAALPGRPLLLTHGTATGRAAGRALLAASDRQAWLPWDSPAAVARFLDWQRPAIGILMETEVWPTLLDAAASRGLPMVLANARLSARSLGRSRLAAALLGPAYRSLAVVLAQTEDDAARLRLAGAREVRVAGNLKFEVAPDPALLARGAAWRGATGGRAVLLAASTREGEDEPLLAAWRAVPVPRPLLVVVPRHPQRFDAVAQTIAAAGFTLARRSAWTGDTPPAAAAACDVWLGDSMLEMPAWYAMADVALLGGSYAPLGGQNLIEAAACGCPVVMGPHTFNFDAASRAAEAAGAALRVNDVEAGIDAALRLIAAPPERDAMARATRPFAASRQGAARMTAGVVASLIAATGPLSRSSGEGGG